MKITPVQNDLMIALEYASHHTPERNEEYHPNPYLEDMIIADMCEFFRPKIAGIQARLAGFFAKGLQKYRLARARAAVSQP